MKITSIKEGKIYSFKNIDSLNDLCNGKKILIKEVVNEDKIIVDFIDYKRPILIDASLGIIEYRSLLNMVISAKEVKRLKNWEKKRALPSWSYIKLI